jgi:cytochrome c-type biogenesis protein CcmH/NrfG
MAGDRAPQYHRQQSETTMSHSTDELRSRMASKDRDALRSIIDAPDGQYTEEAQQAARAEIESRGTEEEPPQAPVERAQAGSFLSKLLAILATLAVAREAFRLISHYIVR